MEQLVELPIEKWPYLQEKLKNLWPLNVAGFYALHLNLKCPGVREAFQFKVYCPLGDMNNGFVAINVKPEGGQDCIIFSTTQDTGKLEQALMNTELIDWTQRVCIDCVPSGILTSLDRVKREMKFSLYEVGLAKTFFLDKKKERFRKVGFPTGTNIAKIKEEDLERVDLVWPYKFPGSLAYFSILVSNGLSYGLYLNDKLVAWVFLNEYYFLCHLYCEKDYRRKGYAEYLMKYVVNKQLELGNDLYAYVANGNEKPIGLFEKLGFVDIDRGAWIFVQK